MHKNNIFRILLSILAINNFIQSDKTGQEIHTIADAPFNSIKTKEIQIDCDNDGYPTIKSLKKVVLDEFFVQEPKDISSPKKNTLYQTRKALFHKNLVITSVDGGAFTDRIYAVSLKNDPKPERNIIFLKISSHSGSGTRLINMQETFLRKLQRARYPDTSKKIPQKDLPIMCWIEKIFQYKTPNGQTNLIEITHAAQGKQVYEIYTQGTPEEVKACAYAIGKAIGSFQQAFMNYVNPEDPATWITVAHNDLHGGNVFFNEKTNRVYFIDNEMMRTECGIINDIGLNLGFHQSIISLSCIKGYIASFPIETNKREIVALFIKKMLQQYQGWDQFPLQSRHFLDTVICAHAQRGDTFTPLEIAIAEGNSEKITTLIKAGADINQINTKAPEHTSPLIVAIRADDQKIITLLRSLGAKIDLKLQRDQTYARETLKHYVMTLPVGAFLRRMQQKFA